VSTTAAASTTAIAAYLNTIRTTSAANIRVACRAVAAAAVAAATATAATAACNGINNIFNLQNSCSPSTATTA
jgi:hypothetical protein